MVSLVSSIDKKLLRDISRLRGQVITIALVVASGIAGYVTMQGTYTSLEWSRSAYYERYRFADVFVHVKRAPLSLVPDLEQLPGVASVHSRVVETVSIPVETLPEPASGTIVSVPDDGRPPLNDLFLKSGRYLDPGRTNEVLVLDSFAREHFLEPGDSIPIVVNGTLRHQVVVGTAMSPEFVFAMPPGSLTADPKRFGVLWMSRSALGAVFEMDGAFNDAVIRLQPGASQASVITEVDRILEPYGSLGAIGRDKQLSNWVLDGELRQLQSMATFIPLIFLGVAAFLLNVVLARLVSLQRSQIAALKALGYPDRAIGFHYVKLVSVIVLIGAIIGVALGSWLGRGMTELYTQFFSFPLLRYRLDPGVVVTGIGVSLVAALVGALASARQVAKLPPAEAMRPPAPASFKPTFIERMGVHSLLSPSARMVLREVERRPLRLALSALGISMAVAILVTGRFSLDSIDYLMRVQFHEAWREDVSVTFSRPLSERAVREVEHLPGVLHAEGHRAVPVRIRSGAVQRDVALLGYEDGGELRYALDADGRRIELPKDGTVLSRKLAEILGVRVGDTVDVQIQEGDRGRRPLLVTGTIDDSFGLQGYMRLETLQDFVHEQGAVSQVLMRIDPARLHELETRLKEMPAVASVLRKQTIIDQFKAQTADWMVAMMLIMTVFASVIAIGVVYNNARVALSVRARDLGSLRVLGFTRREISAILLGELSLQVLLAIPIGLAVGTWMAHAMMSQVDPEQYRMPVIISAQTYAFAVLVTIGAGIASALLVRRKLDRLDLIAVLKTRE
jgi:putative ABC transport system permease protein